MGLRNFEAQLLRELRRITGDSSLRQKDIREWSNLPVTNPMPGEELIYLPESHMHVAYIARKEYRL